MTATAPMSVSDLSVNGAGQDADPVTQLVEAAERYKFASQVMAVAANTAVEAEQLLQEADCAAQEAQLFGRSGSARRRRARRQPKRRCYGE